MKAASLLLALVMVIGFVREADGSSSPYETMHVLRIGNYKFGFSDCGRLNTNDGSRWPVHTNVYIGPLGEYRIPFTARQSLIGFCFIFATLIIVPVVLTVRWKKKRAIN